MNTSIMNGTNTISRPSSNLIKTFFSIIKMWVSKSRSRKHLSDLPDHLLADVGLSEEQATKESNRVFWD
ncbi:DUF1127 domain-containing protein [Vibrio kyushuensis]|uniref:DUF1127 domain-containing protein n=1 Tax=Vibrio TaxID=662 RepID=UPI003D13BDEE